jgi:pimeloyl-ACP methyl ester carboxylesterase
VLLTQVKKSSELAGVDPIEINFNERISKVAFDMVRKETDLKKLAAQLNIYFQQVKENNPDMMPEEFTKDKIAQQVSTLTSPWLSYFIQTNPDRFISKVSCPVLAINGELDFQVIPELNLQAIEKSLHKARNQDTTIKKLKGLNHLFQNADTGASTEYAKIDETVSTQALKLVADWINKRF